MASLTKIALNILIIIVLLGAVFFLYRLYGETVAYQLFGDPAVKISINEVQLTVDIADEPHERRQGLSGRRSLGDFESMLFIFDEPGYHGIWMKDMQFAIDIIWINEDLEVIYIEHNVHPETYPATFIPPEPARFVLETRAFFADTFKIAPGDRLELFPPHLPADLR
jgi:uncharacterized membrane protein (UPF0127 family)